MSAADDIRGIRAAVRALRADGWNLDLVNDGGEDIPVRTETEAIDAITAVDAAWLYVTRPSTPTHATEHGWAFFVLGNGPDEVLNDYTLNLDVLGGLPDLD